MERMSLYVGTWDIWLERNNRAFRNKSKSVDEIVQPIVWNVSEWETRKVEFEGVSLDAMNRS